MSERLSAERLETARNLSGRILRDRHLRDAMPETLDGSHAIVIADPDEQLDDVCRRLERVGPHSTVVFRRDGALVILHVEGPFS